MVNKIARSVGRRVRNHWYNWCGWYDEDVPRLSPPGALRWSALEPCPVERVEAAAVQLGPLLYLLNGYRTIGEVLNRCDVFDLRARRWVRHFATHPEVGQTHAGVTSDGLRHIYFTGGQFGANCCPPTDRCFSYDTQTDTWTRLPPLPTPRYVAAAHLWRGRLHVLAGSREDRWTPLTEHLSLAVDSGRPLETEWRREVPIPRGGIHRGSVVHRDAMYVFGGNEGDVMPIPGDPTYLCNWNTPPEFAHGEVYRLRFGASSWDRLADLPKKLFHNDGTTVALNDDQILVFGGNTDRLRIEDEVWSYSIRGDRWERFGHLPHGLKGGCVALFEGNFYSVCGQRGLHRRNPKPGRVVNSVWVAPVPAT